MKILNNIFVLCFFVLPSLSIANDIDKIIFDIKQIISKEKNIDLDTIQIIKPDNRLKHDRCVEDLSVKFPFKNHNNIFLKFKNHNCSFILHSKLKKIIFILNSLKTSK